MRLRFLLAVLLAVPLLAGCNADDTVGAGDPFAEYDFDPDVILQNEANDVITATYIHLDAEAADLDAAVAAFADDRTAANLEAARSAWRDTREPWEQSESFLFGPVADDLLDPALDSWPTDNTAIQRVLSSEKDITPSFIRAQTSEGQGGMKGFHTIELFLFGEEDGARTPSDFTERELDYLAAATQVLRDDAETLAASWRSEGSDFAAEFASGEYSSGGTKGALEELAEGMTGIANEVGSGKIGTPLDDNSIKRIESKYSENSFTDFKNNVRSIRHIYTGDYREHEGPGLDEIVREVDPKVAAEFNENLQAALDALGDIDTSFRGAVEKNETAQVEAARDAVVKVSNASEKIESLISNL